MTNSNQEKHLLIVDDSPYNIFVLQELISFDPSLKDYIVDTALNGQEAIEKVREGGQKCKYSSILLDLHMPVMDGEEAATLLRQMEGRGELDMSETKIVVLSAINEDEFDRINHNKIFDYFRKYKHILIYLKYSAKTS